MSRHLVGGLVIFGVLLAACGAEDDNGESAEQPGAKKVLGVAMIDLSFPFFVEMREAGLEAADDYGVEASFQSSDGSLEKQLSIVENFIAQDVDAILINAIDDEGIIPAIRKAEDAGIPVIMMANDLDDPYPFETLYSDYDNMAMQARALATSLGGEGDVSLLIGAPGNSVSDNREAGFTDTIEEEFPGINIVSTEVTNWDPSTAADVTQTVINRFPDIDGISCVSGNGCIAAMTAAEAAGKTDIKWGSHDGNLELFPAIEDGSLVFDTLIGGETVGYWNVAFAARLVEGSEFPKSVYLPAPFVSSEETGERLQAEGLDFDFITPEEAEVEAGNYREQFGPQADDEDFDQEQSAR